MGNQQSGAGGGAGKDKGENKEKKKYEPPVPTRWEKWGICVRFLSEKSGIKVFEIADEPCSDALPLQGR